MRADIKDVNGPPSIKTKAEVISYLKNSFVLGRKAISSLTNQNAMDMINFRWRKLPRIDLAFYALTHANGHYGQMALYLRLCGIIPPPTLIDRQISIDALRGRCNKLSNRLLLLHETAESKR